MGVHVNRWIALLTTALAGTLLPGCGYWPAETNPFTTVVSSSDTNDAILSVYGLVTIITVVVGILVFALLAYTVIRFRDDGSEGNPKQIHGNAAMEMGWTLIPVVLVIIMVVPTIRTVFAIGDVAPDGALEIRVVGKRWWWEFEYIESGVVTANEMHVPAGRPVSLRLESDSVIHSFWVPRLGGKRDAVPGRMNRMWWTVTDEIADGESILYRGECAEFCGESHALMRFDVIAQPEADFQTWLTTMQAPPDVADAVVRTEGEAAFKDGGCIGCHALANIDGAESRIAPSLTRVGQRHRIAAGTLVNSEDSLRQWIRDQEAIKPGTSEDKLGNPRFDGMVIPVELTDQQVDVLAAYLWNLK